MSPKGRKTKARRTTRDRSVAITDGFIFRYLEGLDTPRSLTVWLLYSNREHQQLIDLEPNFDVEPYLNIRSVSHAIRDYQATEFLSKSTFLDLKHDLKEVALSKFKESEVACAQTNRRLLRTLCRGEESSLCELLSIARKKIIDILGRFDPSELLQKVNWGPGSTVALKRTERQKYDKFRLEGGISYQTRGLWEPIWDVAFPRWRPSFETQTACVHTVPKNSKTDRTIIIEPGINTFLQKGLGKMIRRRLCHVGIDLRVQADRHREIISNPSLCTLDFKAASDSLSIELIRELLPADWFKILDLHRSRFVLLGNEIIQLEKFSSMGNGFTFELETLVFYALAYAVCEKGDYISVFGDDVIIPAAKASRYEELCHFVGLTLNRKKSHATGYFRESCGEHLFHSISARPLYLRSRIRSIHDILRTANQVRRLAHRTNLGFSCDKRFYSAWRYLTGASVGKRLRCNVREYKIPDGYGDAGLVVNFDEAPPRFCPRSGHFLVRGIRLAFRKDRFVDDDYLLLTRLFELDQREEAPSEGNPHWSCSYESLAELGSLAYGNTLTDLSSKIITRVVPRMIVHQWYDLGPWEESFLP